MLFLRQSESEVADLNLYILCFDDFSKLLSLHTDPNFLGIRDAGEYERGGMVIFLPMSILETQSFLVGPESNIVILFKLEIFFANRIKNNRDTAGRNLNPFARKAKRSSDGELPVILWQVDEVE